MHAANTQFRGRNEGVVASSAYGRGIQAANSQAQHRRSGGKYHATRASNASATAAPDAGSRLRIRRVVRRKIEHTTRVRQYRTELLQLRSEPWRCPPRRAGARHWAGRLQHKRAAERSRSLLGKRIHVLQRTLIQAATLATPAAYTAYGSRIRQACQAKHCIRGATDPEESGTGSREATSWRRVCVA